MAKRTCPDCGCEQDVPARGPAPRCAPCKIIHLGVCAFDGCEKARRGREWCITHYTRWYKHGDVNMVLKGGPEARTCIVDDCDRGNSAYGYCDLHTNRLKARGSLDYAPAKNSPCEFEGCDQLIGAHGGRGYCTLHFKRLYKYGDPRGIRIDCGICGTVFYPVNSLRLVCDGCMETEVRQSKVSAAQIAERDGNTCKLCLVEIDMTILYPDPRCATVDHIIPWSLGGTHALENLQLACFGCNIRKGNKTPA